MTEKDLNRAVAASLRAQGWGHKLPDPTKGEIMSGAAERPFDGFGVTPDFFMAFESKLIKGGYSAFNFGSIRDHQIENLKTIKVTTANWATPAHAVITLGIYEMRKYFDVYFFDIQYILSLMESGKKSLLKKELLQLKSEGKFRALKKGLINLENIQEVIITCSVPTL